MSGLPNLMPLMTWFQGEQVKELSRPQNVAKSDWRHVNALHYFRMIEKNVKEARECTSDQTLIAKCADIANLAMMAAGVKAPNQEL